MSLYNEPFPILRMMKLLLLACVIAFVSSRAEEVNDEK